VNVQRIPHTLGAATGKARENTVVAGGCCSNKAEAVRIFLSAGIREDYWKGTPAVPTVLLCM